MTGHWFVNLAHTGIAKCVAVLSSCLPGINLHDILQNDKIKQRKLVNKDESKAKKHTQKSDNAGSESGKWLWQKDFPEEISSHWRNFTKLESIKC